MAKKHLDLTAGWTYPSSGNIHAGFDYRVPIGTRLFAVRSGRILQTRDTIDNMRPEEDGKTGDPVNFIHLGITFRKRPATVLYLHVSPNIPVKPGDEVEAGQLIGRSGHNGHSEGPHLHITVMKGHNHENPFDYLSGLTNSSPRPTDGLAENGITIFPPSLVYKRRKPSPFASGDVIVEELKFGARDSDSVRRLQHRLNQIPLEGGAELPLTGNYLELTRDEIIKWQVQRRGEAPGTVMADGNLHPGQPRALFGKRYNLI